MAKLQTDLSLCSIEIMNSIQLLIKTIYLPLYSSIHPYNLIVNYFIFKMSRRPGSIKKPNQIHDLTNHELTQVPTLTHPYTTLILDHNHIIQGKINQTVSNVEVLSINHNEMKKIIIKPELTFNCSQFKLKHLKLNHNQIQFMDLSKFNLLSHLQCTNNRLANLILPPSIVKVDCSDNVFTNIGHSLLANKSYYHLNELKINHNQLYDIKLSLSTNTQSQCPALQKLQCQKNQISAIQSLPKKLKELNLAYNPVIFDRTAINETSKLKTLNVLNITGMSLNKDCDELLRTKIPNIDIIQDVLEEQIVKKESPFKLFMENEKTQKNYVFTLGDCLDDEDDLTLDPSFQSSTVKLSETPLRNINNKPQPEKKQPSKYIMKIKSQSPLTFVNHYCHFMDELLEYSLIPFRPLTHEQKKGYTSDRIDIPLPGRVNEYSVLDQMFKARGGVHYVRKIYNWEKTGILSERRKKQQRMMFVNKNFTKAQFESLCDGQFQILENTTPKIKSLLTCQPSSFTCYHVLLRVEPNQEKDWNCMYLVECAHL